MCPISLSCRRSTCDHCSTFANVVFFVFSIVQMHFVFIACHIEASIFTGFMMGSVSYIGKL